MSWYADENGVIRWTPGGENPDDGHVDVTLDPMETEGDVVDDSDEDTRNPYASENFDENPDEDAEDNPQDGVLDEDEDVTINGNGKRNIAVDFLNSKRPERGTLLARLEALKMLSW